MCATYDALYVALAEGADAKLVTRDARLANGIDSFIDVVPVRLMGRAAADAGAGRRA